MATLQELQQRAAHIKAATPVPTPPPAAVPGVAVSESELAEVKSNLRVFHHPVAGSNTITPKGKILTFAGPITGTGDRRVVGEGHIETDDAEDIAWLESVAAMRSNMVTEVKINATGTVVKLQEKKVDPSIQQAVSDAAKNAVDVGNVAGLDKAFSQAVATGTAADTQNGQNPMAPDMTLQNAMQASIAAGDQSKTGTVHNG